MQDKLKKLFEEIKLEESICSQFNTASIEKVILYDNNKKIFNTIFFHNKLYVKYYCKYHGRDMKADKEYSEDQARERAQIAEKYGFVDIKHALFYRTRTFTAKEYIELLGTYSDHIAIEKTIRTEFFLKIEEAINQYGGSFTLYDTIDLQLARKP